MKRPRPAADDSAVDATELAESRPRTTQPLWAARQPAPRLPTLRGGVVTSTAPRQPTLKASAALQGAHRTNAPGSKGARPEEEEEEEEGSDAGSAAGSDTEFAAAFAGGEDGASSSSASAEAVPSAISAPRAPAPVSDQVTTFAVLAALPRADAAARRAASLESIATLAQRILAAPEFNMAGPKAGEATRPLPGTTKTLVSKRFNTLGVLHSLCCDPDPEVRRLAMLSQAAVFKDILPEYRLRPEVKVPGEVVSAEVRRLRDSESALLKGYQRFLKHLEGTVLAGEAASRKLGRALTRGSAPLSSGVGFDVDARIDPLAAATGGAAVRSKDYKDGRSSARKAGGGGPLSSYEAPLPVLVSLGLDALRALSELLGAHPGFNFSTNIIELLVPRLHAKDDDVSAACVTGVGAVFTGDTTLTAAAEVARVLADGVRVAAVKPGGLSTVRPEALGVLLKLRLGVLEKYDHREGETAARAMVPRSGKDAAANARGATAKRLATAEAENEVLEGLRLADAEALGERRTHGKSCLKAIIAIYFRVLKSITNAGHLLPPVLAGLARFGHLIDVGVVSDLLEALKTLLSASAGSGFDADEEGIDVGGGAAVAAARAEAAPGSGRRVKLSVGSSMHAVTTALRIMSGPGSVLNADEGVFARFLYGLLPRIAAGDEADAGYPSVGLAVAAVEALLVDRREYSLERVAAFVKRGWGLALVLPPAGALAFISLGRVLMQRYGGVAALLRAGTVGGGGVLGGTGSGGMFATAAVSSAVSHFDCDRPGALHESGWELATLAHHWHPAVRSAAVVAARLPLVPPTPAEAPNAMLSAYDASEGTFNPSIPAPRPHPLAVKRAGGGEGGKKRQRPLFLRPPHHMEDAPPAVEAGQHALGGSDVGVAEGARRAGKATSLASRVIAAANSKLN